MKISAYESVTICRCPVLQTLLKVLNKIFVKHLFSATNEILETTNKKFYEITIQLHFNK